MTRFWTCQRIENGVRCRHLNPSRNRVCSLCGKRRAPRKKPKHLVALESNYDYYIELNGGERCGICLRDRGPSGRRLDRDHDHKTGRPRGLLCARCNRALPSWMTSSWLRAAADYLDRANRSAA